MVGIKATFKVYINSNFPVDILSSQYAALKMEHMYMQADATGCELTASSEGP